MAYKVDKTVHVYILELRTIIIPHSCYFVHVIMTTIAVLDRYIILHQYYLLYSVISLFCTNQYYLEFYTMLFVFLKDWIVCTEMYFSFNQIIKSWNILISDPLLFRLVIGNIWYFIWLVYSLHNNLLWIFFFFAIYSVGQSFSITNLLISTSSNPNPAMLDYLLKKKNRNVGTYFFPLPESYLYVKIIISICTLKSAFDMG